MAILYVQNVYTSEIPQLGIRKKLDCLSKKRITKSAREHLRQKYGKANVKISCEASFSCGVWTGKCKIFGKRYNFEIR